MADSTKVRLVRCPKCENLLPELPGYSVYQCGGCGAVLRAKKSDLEGGREGKLSEKSEDSVGKSESGAENREENVTENGGKAGNAAESHGSGLKEPAENGKRGTSYSISGEMESIPDQPKPNPGKTNELKNSDGFVKLKGVERGEIDGLGRIRRVDPEGFGFRSLNYAGEGTSRYHANENAHRSAAMTKNQAEVSNYGGFEDIRPDKEELLRKLDELKEQLSKSCDVNGEGREKAPMDSRVHGRAPHVADAEHWYPDHPSGFRRGSRQLYASDEHCVRPNSFDHYREPYSAAHRGYEKPFRPDLYMRPQRSFHEEFDPAVSQFPCSCYQCYRKSCQIPLQNPSTAYRRYPLASKESRGPYDPPPFDARIGHPGHMGSYDLQPHTRWPSELNRVDGFAPFCPQRVMPTNGGRRCRPMAGGAPFVTCHNCFELLELPKKAHELDKCQWTIRCGGCSSVISFSMLDEKLVPVDTPAKQTFMDAFDSSGEVLHDRPYDPHRGMRRDSAGFHFEDYENSGYDFNSSKSEELQSAHLISSSTSEDEVCSSKYRAVNRLGKGNLSSRSDQERALPGKNNARKNSLKESLATELDISHNDYVNTGVSQDSADTSGEEDPPKAKRGVDSFFAGIIKKSFRDISKSGQTAENGKRSVFVNGRLVPDKSVKKAEKLAGPISPGQYWYDPKAGFWGVMGGPCLGIIPPHIEEFNYPVLQNCAAGNTGVLVNGRELHQSDLELLASRGLPVTSNRSYIIDISGKVIDEDTGEELDCLGKLAPTIEKVKHGFGMRVPKAVS